MHFVCESLCDRMREGGRSERERKRERERERERKRERVGRGGGVVLEERGR